MGVHCAPALIAHGNANARTMTALRHMALSPCRVSGPPAGHEKSVGKLLRSAWTCARLVSTSEYCSPARRLLEGRPGLTGGNVDLGLELRLERGSRVVQVILDPVIVANIYFSLADNLHHAARCFG